MKRTIIATLIALASTSALAAETIYEGRGNIYTTPATLADLLSEATRLNTYNHGNTIALQIQNGQIVGLQQDQVRQDAEFKADQARQDAAQRDADTRITSNTTSIQQLGARADDSDLAMVGVQQVNQRQDIRLAGHDAALAQQDQINEALSTSVAGLYTDMSGLRGEVRQARREAKEAKAGAAVALAVAAQQFSTDRSAGFQTSVSAATVGGYQALAVGVGGAVTDTVFVNGALSKSSNQTGAALAVTKRW